jgi:uncharacterized protein (TIGR02147 family)
MNAKYDYQKLLKNRLSERVAKNPRYSLRAFAQSLGLTGSALSQIIGGTRYPSPKMAERIFGSLDFDPQEQDAFLNSLAQAKKIAGLKRLSPSLKKRLQESGAPSSSAKELTFETFKVIADWYHYAILELTLTKNFQTDASWIAQQLGISQHEASTALDRLLDLGLIEVSDKTLKKTDRHLNTQDQSMTSGAHRRRQKQILEKSIYSLENDPIADRNHTAMTLAIDAEKLPEAKIRIQKFMSELTQFLETGSQTRVYEMVVNLFPLQQNSEQQYPVPKKNKQ